MRPELRRVVQLEILLPSPGHLRALCAVVQLLGQGLRSCRNTERSRRSLLRRATPLDCGRPLGPAIIVQHREKQSSRNLSEPGGGDGGGGSDEWPNDHVSP